MDELGLALGEGLSARFAGDRFKGIPHSYGDKLGHPDRDVNGGAGPALAAEPPPGAPPHPSGPGYPYASPATGRKPSPRTSWASDTTTKARGSTSAMILLRAVIWARETTT